MNDDITAYSNQKPGGEGTSNPWEKYILSSVFSWGGIQHQNVLKERDPPLSVILEVNNSNCEGEIVDPTHF